MNYLLMNFRKSFVINYDEIKELACGLCWEKKKETLLYSAIDNFEVSSSP